MKIKQRLDHARKVMKSHQIDAIYIPTCDPHHTEYLPEHWALRRYLSTFEGSAGTLVITDKSAALWTDSRYWIEAEARFNGTEITLMRQGDESTPTISDFLKSELHPNCVVGFDPEMVIKSIESKFKIDLKVADIEFKSIDTLGDELWIERAPLTSSPIVEFPLKFAGLSRVEKIKNLRADMKKMNANAFLISSLYDIAWLFNLRGDDTPCTPIFIAHALVSDSKIQLFAGKERFSSAILKKLEKEGIEVYAYNDIYSTLKKLPKGTSLFAQKESTCVALWDFIPSKIMKIKCDKNPIAEAKSIKNKVELRHLHDAMIFDGIALTRFYCELEAVLKQGESLTEHDAALMLDYARSEMPLNKGISFNSIVAYQANGAMCHYQPSEDKADIIKPIGSLLIDSGGQYMQGTTDITRTVALGKVSAQYKRDYTYVLKGHLAISRAIFLKGTKGCQIDILARQSMWENGIDFTHGTGHGIGFYLNVHEGPCGISSHSNAPLQVGQCITNEPGIYRKGEYGIRIENVINVVECKKTEFGTFLGFENLTVYPYDLKSIDGALLTHEEVDQINHYHYCVFQLLSPYLSKKEVQFLKRLTTPIHIH